MFAANGEKNVNFLLRNLIFMSDQWSSPKRELFSKESVDVSVVQVAKRLFLGGRDMTSVTISSDRLNSN